MAEQLGITSTMLDLTPYQGRWVAIRADKVIAANMTLSGLLRDKTVRPTDTRCKVHRPSAENKAA